MLGPGLIAMAFTVRRAAACDADAIAKVYYVSFQLLTFLPMLHTIEEYRWFISNVTLKECKVTVAEDESGIVAFLARRGEEVPLLSGVSAYETEGAG
jgi:hypothetical protein